MMTDWGRYMGAVAQRLLGEPNRTLSTPTEWRYGSHGSLAIDLSKGVWFDHEHQTGGGVLALIERETKRANGEAISWLKTDLGIALPVDPRQPVAVYPYTDEAGAVLFEVVRFEPKDFRQRRPVGQGGWIWNLGHVRRVPFHLPHLLAANGRTVHVVEGEKDVLALEKLGLVATCNPGGAGKWRQDFAQYLRGANATPFATPRRGSSWAISYAGGEGARVRRSARPQMAKLAASRPVDSKTGSVTKAAFAERVGLTRGRISQLISQGLPVTAGGRIEVEAGLRWMEDNLDPDRRGKGGTVSSTTPSLAEARRLHEIVKVQRAKLAYERERGDLVNRSAVKVAVFARAKAERDAHMAWVARVTPLLAAELGADPARTFAALDRLMRDHLVDLARIPLPELRDG
jgi:hypothetical protein